ncbi:NAD(P)/FAD-dependent oxidoreductase [Nocardia camponoti]|uniref:Dehydrogenase n=1 Tax=Nocardia camponoti TaxID=1616106 RepID=A0A917QEI0_9NOCA|nr:FAD-dependent oxidoreductase [Nocardia camponoti]GGK47644.1 dehydrogenase [Nocardia camponoti]
MRIVIIGAGYAGTGAANRIARKIPDATVTVVNPSPDFIERVRLHQHTAGTATAAIPLATMLPQTAALRVGEVTSIGERVVALADGDLPFDYLFVAVGSTARPLPGAIPIATWAGAEEARHALPSLPAGATVTVIGAGLTGIETASEIAETYPDLRIRLVGEEIGPSLSAGGRKRVRKVLDRLGVEVVEGRVEEVTDGKVRVGARYHTSDLTLWASFGAVPDLVARSDLAVNEVGQALVDPMLRSVTDERVFVIGDCAAVAGQRMACATAGPQSAHAVDTLARMLKDRAPQPYSMGYVGQGFSLGRHDAVQQACRSDDRPLPLSFRGPVAAYVKEQVTRYALRAARTGKSYWLPGPQAAK